MINIFMHGHLLIYDHYLTIREWEPNFYPGSDSIKQLAVWVWVSGSPIECYDARLSTFIGNNTGTIVEVDKNMLIRERGKYARQCVHVDLSKPLLAMFAIKGRLYKIEYKGLHNFFLSYGRFEHLKEGCESNTGLQKADLEE